MFNFNIFKKEKINISRLKKPLQKKRVFIQEKISNYYSVWPGGLTSGGESGIESEGKSPLVLASM